ncbi:ABC transporter substrate-binding protein [Pasteurella bettyae]|uniref:ABC transporter, solute-binding protein n=1 Tax=Pasteurella bettyae CCUG 2042 TaxID=1095749 RepID=I3DDG2_9PAST|nr:ABC transporter substrate-binding protein [Pasteurella bettyae]EIJ69755.1 ABC transporter, solute-binding protein [Pasteurella bettyae CCUG 2042]SUB22020.1 bacterial extracellular solute-binding, family 1 protein [Pasteurella bettyae]
MTTHSILSIHKIFLKSTALFIGAISLLPQFAQAEGKLNIYCSVQNTACEKISQAFAKKYHVETQFVRNSTGTTLGKIKAEKDNPQADVWYGGTLEPHLQAADLGLLEKYRSPNQKQILPQFKQLMEQRGEFSSIIYLMELGIGINTQKLEKLNIKKPQCFKDLLKPEFKNEIQYPDPRVSGTGYSFLTTLIALWGEDKAFEYLKALNKNVSQFSKSGLATNTLASGEVAIDISFMHSYIREQEKGAPVTGVLPCEGIGYTLGANSIIKNARNLENAKLFTDWVLTAEAQEIPWREANSYQLPANIHAQHHPKASDPLKLQFIDIDFLHFGSDQESKKLIERWTKMSLSEQ